MIIKNTFLRSGSCNIYLTQEYRIWVKSCRKFELILGIHRIVGYIKETYFHLYTTGLTMYYQREGRL